MQAAGAGFLQDPPRPGDPWATDRVLRAYLARKLPADVLAAATPSLREMAALAAGPLLDLLERGRESRPALTSWDAWGRRVDSIELTPLWRETLPLAARSGLVALPYERPWGEHSRVVQFALDYLFEPSSGVTSCPLAMTDAAAKTLSLSGNRELAARALPRLTSRDPASFWTSGQWMTERIGGSDAGAAETVARFDGTSWRLEGVKWFTSATTSEMALTLARPVGNPPGGAGLALFYLETRLADGSPNGITIRRLKEKLGTWMVPTAEVGLDGAVAVPVQGLDGGVKAISTMLNVTRLWNSVTAAAGMRRAVSLARDWAFRRSAFGGPLAEKPLYLETLADLSAESEGAFHLAFRLAELTGREEGRTLDEPGTALLRALTPIAKATTGRQAVAVASGAIEAFGGAGYVEDTGLPRLLRDAQVLPIWEGTTDVLSLDLLRALGRTGLPPLEREVELHVNGANDAALAAPADVARAAVAHARRWLDGASGERAALEAGARRLALTLGRALELAYLVSAALASPSDPRPTAAARRFARLGVDSILDEAEAGDLADARRLALDTEGA